MSREIKSVGIVGAGAMGSGIAQVAAGAGCSVRIYDTRDGAAANAIKIIESTLEKRVQKGKMDSSEAAAIAQRISVAEKLEDFAETDLMIEAIVEQLEPKKQLFSTLESIVDANCLLATNTSSLSVTAIASSCKNFERVIGLHFFNPAPLMPLVEIIPGLATRSGLAQELRAEMLKWGKHPVVAKDTPGFIVNRVARPFYGEAIRIYEEGLATPAQIDDAMRRLGGFKMGPFELMDFIGHDVNYAVTESVYTAFYFEPRYRPSLTQKRMVEAGWLGRKSGRGFYAYAEGSSLVQESVSDMLGKTILHRILAMLINEAADALYLKVASREDLDLAMTKGVNYPKGLLRWADEWGTDTVLNQLEDLMEHYAEDRYRPSPLLKKMGLRNKKFYE
jgi:3-hydroxybutyryl-CoA dehydrogenase